MQFNRFDLNLLIALDVLLREKNITRAAEKVFVSQPAMSAALHRLRDYFDDPLLVRVGRDMELSPRGQSLVEPVREALLLIQATLGTQPTLHRGHHAARVHPDRLRGSGSGLAAGDPEARLDRGARHPHQHRTRVAYGADPARVWRGRSVPVPRQPRLFEVRAYPETLRTVRLRPVRWICAVDRDHPTVGDSISAEQYFCSAACLWPSQRLHRLGRGTGAPAARHRSHGTHDRAEPAAPAAGAARHPLGRHHARAGGAAVRRRPYRSRPFRCPSRRRHCTKSCSGTSATTRIRHMPGFAIW